MVMALVLAPWSRRMHTPGAPLSGMVALNAVQAPPVAVSAPSVFGVAAVQLTVVAVVVPYFTMVCDEANCA